MFTLDKSLPGNLHPSVSLTISHKDGSKKPYFHLSKDSRGRAERTWIDKIQEAHSTEVLVVCSGK